MRLLLNDDPSQIRVIQGRYLLLRDLPSAHPASVDYAYWYFGSLALAGDAPGLRAWSKALVDALRSTQNSARDACRLGSWEPADRWSEEGGRVYATALNALTLLRICR